MRPLKNTKAITREATRFTDSSGKTASTEFIDRPGAERAGLLAATVAQDRPVSKNFCGILCGCEESFILRLSRNIL